MLANRIAFMVVSVVILTVGRPAGAQPMPLAGGVPSLEARVRALEGKMAALAPVLDLVEEKRLTVIKNESGITVLRLTGINLQVVNGLPLEPWAANGAGNLIIGYDEVRTTGDPSCSDGRFEDESSCVGYGGIWALSHKGGSHTLVIGSENNYSSVVGIVVGFRNTVSMSVASVLGGTENSATTYGATVLGGNGNKASGWQSAVSGGHFGVASGTGAAVSGGYNNLANGDFASVSAGSGNNAAGWAASVCGGQDNRAWAEGASVTGGFQSYATGWNASVSGGRSNTASGEVAAVSGGEGNGASGVAATVSGGLGNAASDPGAHVP